MMLEVSRHPWNHQHNWFHKHIHHFHSLIFNMGIVTNFFLLLTSCICAGLKWNNHLIALYKVCKSSRLSLKDNCNNCLSIVSGNQSWVFIGRTDAEAETPIFGHLMQRADSFERPWCWERLKAVGEGDDRGWDDWMASPTEWTWVGVNSGYYWWTGKPGVLQSMGSQGLYRLSNWTELKATVLNHFSHVWLCDPMKLAYQASLSMGISRQKYWSGLLCPPPGVLPDPAIEPTSPATPAL